MKKKKISTEEQKAKAKIYMAEYRLKNKARKISANIEWLANRSPEKVAEDKARDKINKANWYQENKEEQKRQMQEWNKENPDYISPCEIENPNYQSEHNHKHDLGYWVVYLIKNYNDLGDTYCGQTQNIYNRMAVHKSVGTLNSDKYELIKQCETLEDALEFEAYMHEQGYHGKSGRPFI